MRKFSKLFIALVLIFTMNGQKTAEACTNLIVTKGASKDGSIMITYSGDSHTRYGAMQFVPATRHPKGSMVDIYDYEKGGLRGEIKQVRYNYSAVGHSNEYQVAMGETTFGGRKELVNKSGILDYGSLMYITLQRVKTAREAIIMMDRLMTAYGYGSSGESITIADKNEVWIMEIVGKGEGVKGAVWVARKVPDGYISAHANQARITTFPLNDPENTLYSKDVITFAREKGYFNGEDNEFSFADAYAPLEFGGLRYCEARVWSFFNMYCLGMEQYLDYAMGNTKATRLPLWVMPEEKLSLADVAKAMRDHYTGTAMDMTKDIGAGGEESPYRWRPMSFEVNGKKYLNERATATQQTGFWFIMQLRSWLPDTIGGVNWYGVDDAATSCLVPVYMSSLKVSDHILLGNGSMIEYSPTSMFWIFNRVAQFAYLRYNQVGKTVQEWANRFESDAFEAQSHIDAVALELYETSPQAAREYLTNYSLAKTSELFKLWNKLDRYLMVKFIDGNVKREENGKFLTNGHSEVIPASPEQPGYSDNWKRAVAEDAGDKLLFIELPEPKKSRKELKREKRAKKENE